MPPKRRARSDKRAASPVDRPRRSGAGALSSCSYSISRRFCRHADYVSFAVIEKGRSNLLELREACRSDASDLARRRSDPGLALCRSLRSRRVDVVLRGADRSECRRLSTRPPERAAAGGVQPLGIDETRSGATHDGWGAQSWCTNTNRSCNAVILGGLSRPSR